MILRRLTIIITFLTAWVWSYGQQINAVPDYVFRNQMSVGRNAVTDTAAYFSIGPRYGAVRGMMPPMVVDTASVSGNKRNGLLIFSIQKNKFLYWDSVGSKWAEMAGTAGSAITGTGVAGYMPEFTTATNIDSTSLYHSAGRFAIGSTTTSNGRFSVFGGHSYFDTSLKVGSQTLLADEGKNEVYINTTADSGFYSLQVEGSIYNSTGAVFARNSGNVGIGITNPERKLVVNVSPGTNSTDGIRVFNGSTNFSTVMTGNPYTYLGMPASSGALYHNGNIAIASDGGYISFHTVNSEAGRINSNNELQLGSTTDAGSYVLQVTGGMYQTANSYHSVSSGAFAVGTTSPTGGYKADIRGRTIIKGATGYMFDVESNESNATALLFYVDNGEASILSGGTTPRTIKFYVSGEKFNINSSGGVRFIPQSATPTAAAGVVYYDSDDNKLKVYNGTSWVDLH
jgi:hypothetical protein